MIKKIDFSRYCSLKCGPTLEVFCITSTKQIPKDHKIIGLGNNLLIAPEAKNLAILSKEFDYIKVVQDTLFIGAATPTGKIVSFCKKNDIGGFEFLSGLPGSLGGLLKMNAGLLGYEISDKLLFIETADAKVLKKQLHFSYRYSSIDRIVFGAAFAVTKGFDTELMQTIREKRKTQPKQPSAGSCFKNPQGDFAGRLIEEVGLKGFKKGGFCFSKQHANFLINCDNGTYEDALWLIKEAKKRVKEKFFIELQEEIEIIKA